MWVSDWYRTRMPTAIPKSATCSLASLANKVRGIYDYSCMCVLIRMYLLPQELPTNPNVQDCMCAHACTRLRMGIHARAIAE
jgi:hypothetical protein